MNTTSICLSCFQECEIRTESGMTAVGGTHANFGRAGNHNFGDVEVSDCCGEEVREIDSDLVDWHRDLKILAKCKEVEESKPYMHMINEDPEQHFDSFDAGLSVDEELTRLAEVWAEEGR